MSKFTIIMGSPCTGKTTKYAQVFDEVNSKYNHNIVITEHIHRKSGKTKSKNMGYYFPEINLMFIGGMNKRGQLQGLDVITNSSGVSMDEFDIFINKHNNANIFTEANYKFSPARKMPENIHAQGFDQCNWILLKHKDIQVMIDRKTKRAEDAGRPVTQKSIDSAIADNGLALRMYERFKEQSVSNDSIRAYSSETQYEISIEDLI